MGSVFRPLARVEVLSLDEVFVRYKVEVCNLLKLSCVGAEYDILFKASADTLGKLRAISMEYHVGLNSHSPREMIDFLEKRGYDVTGTPLHDKECGYFYATRRL
jgi:hypothetical protein